MVGWAIIRYSELERTMKTPPVKTADTPQPSSEHAAPQRSKPRRKVRASCDWTDADILALALWLKDGGPLHRLEQYRNEVILQLRASDVPLREVSSPNVACDCEQQGVAPDARPRCTAMEGSHG
jgi:hypothetical protein